MRSYLIFFFASIFFFSCNDSKTVSFISKPGEVPAQEYTIDITKDTVLVAKNGTIFNIPAGSLKSSSNKVTLEIKEAVTIEQIIRSGLTTKSGDDLLSSGGMLYFNVKDGQDVTIVKPVGVSLPTKFIDENMKLYKGEAMADGSINWKDTTPLAPNPELEKIRSGKIMFQNNCAGCHAIGKEMAGPDLAHFKNRFGYYGEGGALWSSLLHRTFKHTTVQYPETTDSLSPYKYYQTVEDIATWKYPESIYFCNLVTMFKGAIGPEFPLLTYADKDAIYSYVQNESDARNLPLPAHAYLWKAADSCDAYKDQMAQLEQEKKDLVDKKAALIADNGNMVEINRDTNSRVPVTPRQQTAPMPDSNSYVTPEWHYSTYYKFNIDAFGWYNIDALMKDKPGITKSNLLAQITGDNAERTQVYLIIPGMKVFIEGGPSDIGKNNFAFDKKNGQIPLPQNEQAYILALNETDGKISYALQQFTCRPSQQFTLKLKETTKEDFNIIMKQLRQFDLPVSVDDAENSNAIRRTDEDLKTIDEKIKKANSLKPKNCDCDCMPAAPADTSRYYK